MISYGLDQQPSPESWTGLATLVRGLMRGKPESDALAFLERLERIVQNYRESFPILSDGRRLRSSVKEARTHLRKIDQGITSDLPSNFLATRELLKAQVKNPDRAAVGALEGLEDRPDHETDEFRVVLASEIAELLEDYQLPVSMTRDDPEADQPTERGAAYARLLRAVLKAAGAEPPNDLLPLMRAGKQTLDERDA